MRVIVVPVDNPMFEAEISNDLDGFKDFIDGYIEFQSAAPLLVKTGAEVMCDACGWYGMVADTDAPTYVADALMTS